MRNIFITLILVLAIKLQFSTTYAQGTAFTYQGRLNSGNAPANGSYDLAFMLYTTNATGVPVVGPVTNSAVSVTNGLFTTLVDLGNAFMGTSNWLEIAVSTNGANAFTTLAPRQQLTPVPYALFAGGANAAGLTGTISPANIANGSITSNLLASGSVGVSQLTTNIGVWTQVGTNLFYSNGNVSIGTTLSQAPLLVRGNGGNNSAAVVGIQITGSENGAGVFGFSQLPGGNGIRGEADVSASDGGTPTGVEAISGATNGIAVFAEAPNTIGSTFGVYSIDNSPNGYAGYFLGRSYFSGNVGIGNATPGSPLAIRTLDGAHLQDWETQAGIRKWDLNINSFTGFPGLYFSEDSVSPVNLVLREGGNVGIGTFAPSNMLSVAGNVDFSGNLGIGTSSPDRPLAIKGFGDNGEWISLKDPNGVTEWHLNNIAGGLNFVQTGVADGRLFLSTNGNVGIGTISPASPLEVVGNIQMGAGGTNYAASGSENLRLVRGVISPTGSILSGSGFNVVSNNVGKFTITFTPGFSDYPAVTVSGASCIATWNTLNQSFVAISIVSYGGTPVNQFFNFIAVGTP